MVASKKRFGMGLALMAGFVVVLILLFSPLFNGENGLRYLDNLYNSISKGSAYYIPKVREEVAPFLGRQILVEIAVAGADQAAETAALFRGAGAVVSEKGGGITVEGDLGRILETCLRDADAMYQNDGKALADRYGYPGKRVLYHWWKSFHELEKQLKKQKRFQEAKITALVVKKAVETSYNYYGITAESIQDRWGVVAFSLAFYVLYTLWYGFAIMYMFEGWGLRIEH